VGIINHEFIALRTQADISTRALVILFDVRQIGCLRLLCNYRQRCFMSDVGCHLQFNLRNMTREVDLRAVRFSEMLKFPPMRLNVAPAVAKNFRYLSLRGLCLTPTTIPDRLQPRVGDLAFFENAAIKRRLSANAVIRCGIRSRRVMRAALGRDPSTAHLARTTAC